MSQGTGLSDGSPPVESRGKAPVEGLGTKSPEVEALKRCKKQGRQLPIVATALTSYLLPFQLSQQQNIVQILDTAFLSSLICGFRTMYDVHCRLIYQRRSFLSSIVVVVTRILL